MRLGSISASVLAAATAAAADASCAPQVKTTKGIITGGKCDYTDSNRFLAIPYGEPPVGKLRWQSPQPYAGPFEGGKLNATTAAPSCIQFSSLYGEDGAQSEDCLLVNVWTPKSATPKSSLPVRVWLYGGSNQGGGISDPTYDGCFTAVDSIVVAVNYRLGPLGFLAATNLGLAGNYGIQDQLLALQWVQENVAAFGGDPSRVSVFGQSAGAADTFTLSTLPQAPKLMRGAAMESGGGRILATVEQAQKWQGRFTSATNCTSIDCMRSMSTDALLVADAAMPSDTSLSVGTPFNNDGARSAWGPLVDGKVVPSQPATVGSRVPAIFGSAAADGSIFVLGQYGAGAFDLTQSDYDLFLEFNFQSLAAEVNETFSLDKFNGSVVAAMTTICTDVSYKCPARNGLATTTGTRGIPAWSYEFGHTPSCPWYSKIPAQYLDILGATHTSEIPFVFNTTAHLVLPNGNCTFTAAEKTIARTMSEAWENMGAMGQPGLGDSWPAWTEGEPSGALIGDEWVVGTVDYSACDFWDKIEEAAEAIVAASS